MALDFSPLYRSSIGFDAMTALFAHALNREDSGFPPYNIEKLSENAYRIVMAVAGWNRDDLELVTEANRLTVRGRPKKPESEKTFLHRGIALRSFERIFDLADHVEVTNASLSDGLLVVDLKREVPEALKPRRIEIETSSPRGLTSIDTARLQKSAA